MPAKSRTANYKSRTLSSGSLAGLLVLISGAFCTLEPASAHAQTWTAMRVQEPPIPIPPKPNQKTGGTVAPRKGRETLDLNSDWRFRVDAKGVGELEQWEKRVPDGVPLLRIPYHWKSGSQPEAGWFWRQIEIPKKWKGQTARLIFGAVSGKALFWFDGQSIGKHDGGTTPFEFNVTQLFKPGGKHLVAVRIEGEKRANVGISDGVQLVSHDEAYLQRIFVRASGLGNLEAEIQIRNLGPNSGSSTLIAKIVSPDQPKRELKQTEQNLSITPELNLTTLLTSLKKKQFILWTLDIPALYRFDLSFRQDLDILDTTETIFGFREFGWKAGRITLNGVPITPSASRLDDAIPEIFTTDADRVQALALLRKSKESGKNLIYLHAPTPPLLQLGDSEGLFYVEGARPGLSESERFSELQNLIFRDRSHPSILAWDIRRLSEAQATKLRTLDSTRFFLSENSKSPLLYPPGSDEGVALPTGFLLEK